MEVENLRLKYIHRDQDLRPSPRIKENLIVFTTISISEIIDENTKFLGLNYNMYYPN
jgi:hypothetical protein